MSMNKFSKSFSLHIVNLFIVAFGILEGWSSPMNVLLMRDESPLPSGKISMEEATWITSLLQVGALICNFVFGYISNNFGRKIPLLVISIPMIVSTTLRVLKVLNNFSNLLVDWFVADRKILAKKIPRTNTRQKSHSGQTIDATLSIIVNGHQFFVH